MLILETARGVGEGSLFKREGSAQCREGEERGGVRQADCSPQFLSSRPLGQSLTPSQAGTQSPFTEQRNSPGHAGGGRVPLGCVIVKTRADAASVCLTAPTCTHAVYVVHVEPMSSLTHAAHTQVVCMRVYTL